MSMILAEAPPDAPHFYRLSVREFDRMVEAGAFRLDARVELVNGELVEMSPIGVGHAYVVRELDRVLGRQLEGRAVVSVQSPLLCSDVSQPQPDLAIVRWPADRYLDRHPNAEDVLLVVEVADSSLRYDEHEKVPMYARAGVPEVWLVDMPHHRVHVFTDPVADGYGQRAARTSKDILNPAAFPDVEIVVSDLYLGRKR